MADAAHTVHVDVVSAEGEIFSGPAEMVFAPAAKENSASRRGTRRSSLF